MMLMACVPRAFVSPSSLLMKTVNPCVGIGWYPTASELKKPCQAIRRIQTYAFCNAEGKQLNNPFLGDACDVFETVHIKPIQESYVASVLHLLSILVNHHGDHQKKNLF